MASSQVEIAASSSPFGCVLRDRNRRERYSRETNARAATFQKNLEELVRDHLHNCISVSSDSSSASADENQINNNIDRCRQNLQSGIHNQQKNNVNDSSSLSQKKARILDRWAAKQAREIVSSIERQSHEAILFVAPSSSLAGASSSSSSTTENLGQNSENPVPELDKSSSSSSSQSQNRGASSLVQIWEARLNNNPNVVSGGSKGSVYTENASSSIEEPSRRHSDAVDPGNITNEEGLADWETSTTVSVSSSINYRNCDAGEIERERVRVADIIRRLTCDGSDSEQQGNHSPRRISCGSDHSEQRSLPQLVSSPKIRGRQAFHELLLRMEQERLRELDSVAERRAVSKFPQRGRIQSMLRLRFLQRGMAIQDQQRLRSTRLKTAAPAANRSVQASTTREKFSLGAEQATAAQSDAGTPKGATELEKCSVDMPNSSNQIQPTHSCRHEETLFTSEQQSAPSEKHSVSQTSEAREEVPEEASASLDATTQGTTRSLELETSDRQDTLETAPFMNEWDENETEVEEEEEEEEADVYQPYFEEATYDWFNEIARPRTYWEGKRQEWYQEMLSTGSESDEIRQLLERKTVSSFLASDLREVMDQLMLSRAQRQVSQEGEFDDENSQERMGKMMLSDLQRHQEEEQQQQQDQEQEMNEVRGREGERVTEVDEYPEEEDEEEEEEQNGEDADESPISTHQYQEAADYFDQSSLSTHSRLTTRSWNYSHYHGVVADQDSDLLSTTPASFVLQSCNQDSQRHSSSVYHQRSIEMELIYDLRGQMEQLQREMFELTKSIQSCMDMQREMQNSMKLQQVHKNPVPGHRRNPLNNRTPSMNRLCCICYEMQVDCFLYRCGHMCTCLKCARELQWSNGKCPICRAQIVDVVRACIDS